MIKKLSILFAISLSLSLFLTACSDSDDTAEDYSSVTANVDEMVQAVFLLTNQFRTGSEAWYWNSDNSTKTSLVGQLETLTLDEDLCRAATVRSQELISNFAHTRPDGRSCFTVLDDLSISYSTCGENIAAGYFTGESVFNGWKEDDEDYDGQGHRRNMLGKNFTKIGIAYVYDSSSYYKYYWTMILTR